MAILRAAAKIFLWTFTAVGLVYMLVTLSPITLWWSAKLAGEWNDPVGDIVIVPGADSDSSGVIGFSSYWRCFYTVLLWRTGKPKMIVVSGGGGVAESMRDFLIAQQIPAEAILTESKSNSTRENATFTRDLIAGMPGKKVLLTSDYHMYRAVRTFRKAGVDVVPHPFGDCLKRAQKLSERMPVFLDLLLESTKIAWYARQGWM